MKQFMNINDIKDIKFELLDSMTQLSLMTKKSSFDSLASNQSPSISGTFTPLKLGLLFFNPSLRTKLSTQIAASELGMSATVIDIQNGGWPIEFSSGAIMNGDKSEHIKEVVGVLDSYFDVLAVRSFDMQKLAKSAVGIASDEEMSVVDIVKGLTRLPFINLESFDQHPLQALADILTIEQTKTKKKPKIVLTWAPHIKNLPYAVPKSFTEFCLEFGHDITVACPKGFEFPLDSDLHARVVNEQEKALKDADYVYAKSWGEVQPSPDFSFDDYAHWMIDQKKMELTNQAKFMHCLPVRRNVVVSDEVLDGKNSIVKLQAANRVVAAKEILRRIKKELLG